MRDLEILLLALVIIFIVLLLMKGQRPARHPDNLTREDDHGDREDERS